MGLPKKTYGARQARAVTGASQRQLDYWAEKGLVVPSVPRKPGKGRERHYTYTDLLKLRTIVDMRNAGISLGRIQKALGELNKELPTPDQWTRKRLIICGKDIYVGTSQREVLRNLTQKGQLAWSVILLDRVRSSVRQMERQLRKAEAV